MRKELTDLGPLIARNRAIHPRAFDADYKTAVTRSPRFPLLSLDSTITEETGPLFGEDILGPLDSNLILNYSQGEAPAVGERIRVHGRVLDENGRPIPKTLIEIWQANAGGRYRHVKDTYFAPLDPNFGGCGRTLTDEDGAYEFLTIRPGAYPWPNRVNDWRPMHIHFSIFGTGFGQRLISQMYFEGDPLIAHCPIANTIKDRGQLDRLIAPLDLQGSRSMDYLAYQYDIVLRGHRQTMFENRPEGL